MSYGVNGGAVTIETVAGPLAAGDTLMYVFTATADMSTDGATYDVALNVNEEMIKTPQTITTQFLVRIYILQVPLVLLEIPFVMEIQLWYGNVS